MDKHLFKILILMFLILGTLAGVWVLRSGSIQRPSPTYAAPPEFISQLPKPSPSPSTKPQSLSSDMLAPNGKADLKFTKVFESGMTRWTLSVNGKEIFNQLLPNTTSISVPYNTFSPDNKYIFLKEDANGLISYPVLATSGELLGKDNSVLEFSSIFNEKYPEFKITEVTGWGGMNLIVFNTDKVSGGVGPSFWFEVPTRSLIRLSSRFN